jgi:hypothetical protein
MSLGHGMLYVADGATAKTISGTPGLMTGWATLGPGANTTTGDLSVVPSVASSNITVKPGTYRVDLSISGTNSAAGDVQANIRVAGSEVAYGQCRANFAASNADNSMGCTCFVTVTASSAITVYLEGGSTDFTPVFGQLCVQRIA